MHPTRWSAGKQEIEQHLFDRVTDLFGLPTTVTLYDLDQTPTSRGRQAAQELAKHGHSKEKRSDCPLLTLALVLDGSGFVRRSEVLAGNVKEQKVLAATLKRLEVPADALIVMDCGAATEENLKWMRQHGYRYLAVSRERTRRFDADSAQCLRTASGQQVHVQLVSSEDGAEVRLYCYSEARQAKEQAMVQRAVRRFEQALKDLHEGLSRPADAQEAGAYLAADRAPWWPPAGAWGSTTRSRCRPMRAARRRSRSGGNNSRWPARS